MSTTRRTFLKAGMAGMAGGLTAPAIARAGQMKELRMVTSWPKNLPGPGVSAERLAKDIETLSSGTLKVKVYAAGELVGALAVFDAVENGTADMAHTASLFWGGKMPAAALFTAGPYGLTPLEHRAWLEQGGGQQLWDELYGQFGIKPLMCGNTGPSMGGWFRKPIKSLDDLKGLKMRMPGLGGEILRRLGGTPVSLPPGEILTALQSGAIDATEFLGPFSDMAMGFYKVAKVYHYPAFHEPNGAGELLIARKVWDALNNEQRRAIEVACSAEAARTLAEHTWRNAEALKVLKEKHGVRVMAYPADVLAAARKIADEVLADLAAKDALSGKIVTSWLAARDHLAPWNDVALRAFLNARLG
ncbi:TRAP transporter substrate-binding protein [Thermopetrobacter sp. TC1]|uniref:TRAP transporter substrate-binding protein n=1 Tax=Thermopetrobacter sp. TC1 TaxID=1495045 RepID=UPI00056E2351|nr:TRAP transporter substrate-binding protein [Thermopetrobacter sp. TC1]